METFLRGLAIVADVLTVMAAIVTFATVFSYWRSRPRLEFQSLPSNRPYPPQNTFVNVSNRGTGRPVRHISIGWACLDADGRAIHGTGADPWIDELAPRREALIEINQTPVFGAIPSPTRYEIRLEGDDAGALCEIYVAGSLVTWRRHRHFVWWTYADRMAGHAPSVLSGKRISAHYDAVVNGQQTAKSQAELT
ncbi:hypothetical protein [Microbacterium sp. cf332]|uniref:hypothetical protein n=1 Tax=Microbacterium sp. cf332 TaxID=1761804 RepID=UPI00115F7D8F|nr:hypothetical protein [Microbacterium sp. cf332]